MTHGLPRNRVLRGYGAFARVLRTGSVLVQGSVKLWYVPGRSSDSSKFGVAVSGASGSAVMRNRVKRCLREAIRLHQDRVHIQKAPPLEIVLMYTVPAKTRSQQIHCGKIEQQVVVLLERLMKKVLSS